MDKLNDQEIASLVQSGKSEYFGVLINRYEIKISRYAWKFLSQKQDIQDIVQDIFLKAYKNIHSFDTTRKFSSWLYRIAHNELVNVLKKKSRNPLLFFDLDTFIPHFSYQKNNLEKKIDDKKIKKDLHQCLGGLGAKYKEIIILHYFEEFNYQEISDILKIPLSTVGTRIKRAKDKIKELLKYE